MLLILLDWKHIEKPQEKTHLTTCESPCVKIYEKTNLTTCEPCVKIDDCETGDDDLDSNDESANPVIQLNCL